MEKYMKLRKFIATTIREYLNEQQKVESNLNGNFWKWFGNSKVVDEQVNPMVVYHGTDNKFDVFKISKYGANGAGIYLTTYKDIAKNHGKYLMELYVKIEDDSDGIVTGYEVVMKKPQNIKSIYNDGSWDIDDKNIYS
jgi:hypothetical protein